jgi:hypothetical protein
MMLTEPYYYYANYPAAKAASRATFDCAPISAKPLSSAGIIATFNSVHDHETAHDPALLLDSQSRDGLAEYQTQTAGRPASGNAKPPLTRPRGTSSWTG